MKRLIYGAAILISALFPVFAAAQADPTSRSWNQPVEPYRIIGNVYYVGASDIASFLIATPAGHVILDAGFEETVPIIRDNVKKLGFKIEDVKILIIGHAHYDHVGGLADLKALTGAKLAVSKADAALLASGGKKDYLFTSETFRFKPVQTDRILKDGDTVTLGGTTLTAHLTPGHTKGNTTWTMKAKEGGRTYDVVVMGSPSINPGTVLKGMPTYPNVGEDYAKTFRILKSLPCDVFLATHASFYDGLGKAEKLRAGAKENPFIDPQGYRAVLERREKMYHEQLEKERARAPARP
jgi:metallo-beta-lactamase class B